MFKFTVLSLLSVTFSLFATAFAVVFTPPVTTPSAGDVWVVGTRRNVTWDTSGAPVSITNPNGKVVLAKNGRLDIRRPLAFNFSILDGWITITVPDVETGVNYTIVLFGDSGNHGAVFSIVPLSAKFRVQT